jgi:hypothetical protein
MRRVASRVKSHPARSNSHHDSFTMGFSPSTSTTWIADEEGGRAIDAKRMIFSASQNRTRIQAGGHIGHSYLILVTPSFHTSLLGSHVTPGRQPALYSTLPVPTYVYRYKYQDRHCQPHSLAHLPSNPSRKWRSFHGTSDKMG